jgi:hypothetical protein
MHLTLFTTGMDTGSVLLVVSSATILGWLCAQVRDQYQSWIPAFFRHFAANAGGMFGGIVYAIGYQVLHGYPAPQ